MDDLDREAERQDEMARTALKALLGTERWDQVPDEVLDDTLDIFRWLPDERLSDLVECAVDCDSHVIRAKEGETPADIDARANRPEVTADRVYDALSKKPKLLNAVILRALEEGLVADNIAYLANELDVKVAGPWLHEHSHLHTRHRVNHRGAIADIRKGEHDFAYRVLGVDGHDGFAVDVDTAKAEADKGLRATGWILL